MSIARPDTPQAADRLSHIQDVLTGFVDYGDRLARLAVEQAEASILLADTASKIYDRVTRSARRSAMLVRALAEPVKSVDRVAARKRIIRVVEDNIQRHPDEPEADSLHQEFLERLDAPDWEEELGDRPVEEIIIDIIRDLGLASGPGCHPWKRRTPADIAELCALAARPAPTVGRSTARPALPSAVAPAFSSQTDRQPAAYNST
jgi:hypothetical protein